MAFERKFSTHLLLLFLTIYHVNSKSIDARNSGTDKRSHKDQSSKSKLKIDKGNPWPFLPSPGSHYTKTKGYPSYPFMILSPPGQEKENEEQLKDEKGSKYFVTRRQSVPVPYQQQSIVGYVPVYYIPQYYSTYQPVYTSYYQPNVVGNAFPQPYLNAGQSFGYSDYPLVQSPFSFSKRSDAKKHDKNQSTRRQFVPRHHWAFSQWPFDSHEYAFTKDPIYSSNHPHLPRWGPMQWGGAGPGRHWAINREGLPSPFGIGLAPHMGGQGYIGQAGRWPGGYGYPFPTHFPTPPHLQHLLP